MNLIHDIRVTTTQSKSFKFSCLGAGVPVNPEPHKPSKLEERYDEFPFCNKCKEEVKKLYDTHTEMTKLTQKFETERDAIAATMIKTFVEQQIVIAGPGGATPKGVSLKKSSIDKILKSKSSYLSSLVSFIMNIYT